MINNNRRHWRGEKGNKTLWITIKINNTSSLLIKKVAPITPIVSKTLGLVITTLSETSLTILGLRQPITRTNNNRRLGHHKSISKIGTSGHQLTPIARTLGLRIVRTTLPCTLTSPRRSWARTTTHNTLTSSCKTLS